MGYRNNYNFDKAEYILLGDSMLHNLRLSNSDLINIKLNMLSKKNSFYNAAISTQYIGHYLETLKFFKNKNKNLKYIMFIFSGNDFLDYKKTYNNYSNYIENKILRSYFEVKKSLNIYSQINLILKYKNKKNYNKIIKYRLINKEVLFYKDYISPKKRISFSEEFDRYLNFSPDYIFIIPTKYEVYCKNLHRECYKINYKKIFKNLSLFKRSKIIDTSEFFTKESEKLLKKGYFIFDHDDTHSNEIGISKLAQFVYDQISYK